MSFKSIPARLFEQAKIRPTSPAYYVKRRGAWRASSWREYATEVRRAAKSLLTLGLGKGSCVSILGFNRPEWVVMDVACMAIGGAPAGIYTTCSPEEVQYIVHHCEAPVVLLENAAQWAKVKAKRAELPLVKQVVMMRDAEPIDDPLVISWDEFLAKGDAMDDAKVDEAVAALEPDQLATLIYTSGTTGPPKGVMLSHNNLAWTADAARRVVNTSAADCSLSYLPLSHIAEQSFSVHGPITSGSAVYFAEAIDKVPDNLKEVRPTLLFGVPRIWEKFHAGIAGKLAQATGAKAKLVQWARGVGTAYNDARNNSRDPGLALELQYRVAERLVFSKLKEAIGLDRTRVFVSGAAPIAKEIVEFFAGLDIVVREVYGQSEDTGPTSFNLPGRTRFGTVGPPFPGVQVKIAADDEILVKGPNVFLGYYKEPAATAETLVDGWLHSGDLGRFDRDGYLTITGRKKDIIITAGGKNIAPKNIESAIKNDPLVAEAVVIGDRRKFLSALVTLDPEAIGKVSSSGAPHADPAVRAAIQRTIDDVNAKLARVETVKKFTILSRPFTIEDGELTPTLKVKRNKVNEHFSAEIEAMYDE